PAGHQLLVGPEAHEQAPGVLPVPQLRHDRVLRLMIWKGLIVATGSESPVVVVLSGSMEPGFYRGDLLFLTNDLEDPIRAGDIAVFRIKAATSPSCTGCCRCTSAMTAT
ncbi:hypothetical protein BOX15_Mlig014004g1, partial [Macrostomum lignano]